MADVFSDTIVNNAIVATPRSYTTNTFTFELDTGNEGVLTVVEQMLKTQSLATLRANSEFLKNGFSIKKVSIKTYRTDLKINDIILVNGVKFKVIGFTITSNKTSVITSVEGVRYE